MLIGNAAATLHGGAGYTIDLDFFIRRAPANRKKLAGIATALGVTLSKRAANRPRDVACAKSWKDA